MQRGDNHRLNLRHRRAAGSSPLWFVCLALTGKFLPTCYVLQITYKIYPDGQEVSPGAAPPRDMPPRHKYMLLTLITT